MARRFRRSRTDVQIAGVCAGLADYLQMDVGQVRLFTVILAFFTSAPVLGLYILAAVFVPKAPEGEETPGLDVQWQSDGMRVTWRGAIAPHAIRWVEWLGAIAGGVVLISGTLFVLFVLSHAGVGGGSEALDSFFQGAFGVLWTAALVAAMAGNLPRPWALTLTHDALWIDRPLRRPERIDLSLVERVLVTQEAVVLQQTNGTSVQMPAPPEPGELDPLLEELAKSRRRALEHQEDLSAAAVERSRLERLTSEAPLP